MKFNSQIATTVEQSKRLLMLGLKPETADMHHSAKVYWGDNWFIPEEERHYLTFPNDEETFNYYSDTIEYIPAWSLHRLIELYKDVEDTSMWSLENVNYNRLIQCIGLAIKHNDFNKEYLR